MVLRLRRRAAVMALAAGVAVVAGPVGAQEPVDPVVAASVTDSGPERLGFQCLMGGVAASGEMVGYEEAVERLRTGAVLQWFNLAGGQGTGPSGAAVPHDIPCDWAYTVNADLSAEAVGAYLGIGGAGAVLPSVLSLHSPASETYRAVVADYFRAVGHRTKTITLTQVIRTDLEGDGVEEVLITVHDDADGVPQTIDAGDHAAILLRRVVNGAAETVVIDGEFYDTAHDFAAPVTYDVFAIADLNGDGVMEIVATADYYEGYSFAAYAVEGGGPRLAMTCGCGS